MKNIGFSGTFDPLTNGHLWVIQEALNIAVKVYVFVAVNSNKTPMFSTEERVELIKLSTKQFGDRVEVVSISGAYVAQVAKEEYDCDYMIRGIRNAGDFDYESLIQQTNRDVLCGAKTIFVFPPRDLDSVSSSFVKSLVGPMGWHYYVEDFLPTPVINFWIKKVITEAINKTVNEYSVANNSSLRFSAYKKIAMNLLNKLSESKNAYHNMGHILYCWQAFNAQKILNPSYVFKQIHNEFELHLLIAILGHDIIMEKDENFSAEELSSKYVEEQFMFAGLDMLSPSVCSAILATSYLAKDLDGKHLLNSELATVLTSIDLEILASPERIYNKYALAIRKEYAHVAESEYKSGRVQALGVLLELAINGELYLHPLWRDKHRVAVRRIEEELKILNA